MTLHHWLEDIWCNICVVEYRAYILHWSTHLETENVESCDTPTGWSDLVLLEAKSCRTSWTVLKRIFEYIRIFEYFLPNIDIRIRFVDIFRIWILFEYSNILVWIFRNYLMEKYLNFWETKTKFGQYSVSKDNKRLEFKAQILQ